MTFDINKLVKYMEIVDATAKLSKDTSTKVGALVLGPSFEIRSLGYNGAPRGCAADEDERGRNRPEKYFWFSHAELNAITIGVTNEEPGALARRAQSNNLAHLGVAELGRPDSLTGPVRTVCALVGVVFGGGCPSKVCQAIVGPDAIPVGAVPALRTRPHERPEHQCMDESVLLAARDVAQKDRPVPTR